MNIIQGFLLGIIHGITVFLPLSNDGHIAIASHILGIEILPVPFRFYTTLTSLITLLLFFRYEIGELSHSFFRILKKEDSVHYASKDNPLDVLFCNDEESFKTIEHIHLAIFISFVASMIILHFMPYYPLRFIGLGYLFTAILLILSDKIATTKKYIAKSEKNKGVSTVQSIVMGFMQSLGSIFGISPLASTYAGGIFTNTHKMSCSIFTFLIYLPILFLSLICRLKDMMNYRGDFSYLPLIISCVTSLIIGYGSLTLFFRSMKRNLLHRFSYYLIPAGLYVIFFL